MSSTRFEAFAEACRGHAESEACTAFGEYLLARGRGHRIAPERVALDLKVDPETIEDVIEVACLPEIALLDPCLQVRCPRCNARQDLVPVLEALESEGVAHCAECHEEIDAPRALPAEVRYCLTPKADKEAADAQASRAALSPMRAVIICALPVELAAIRTQLRAGGHDQGRETIAGGQIQLKGSFEGRAVSWDLRVALSGQGDPAAASALVSAISAFIPEVALFVGVAGGIPSAGVALGDVVAATTVIAYDGGKDTAQGLQPRPLQLGSAYNLSQVAAHMLLDEAWQLRIQPPGAAGTRAYVEPIAAGNKVIVSTGSQSANLIAQVAPRAVAIEMEGAGFLEAVRRFQSVSGMVIRGISDLLDGKTEADRGGSQARASANAAAFAFELLNDFEPPSK